MTTVQWTPKDFDVFTIDGLEPRMEALIEQVRPKFNELGEEFSHYFTVELGEEFFAHVAKHARRTVNPPHDSWVAFAPNKRGYKAMPHFQIGLFESHLFINLAVIYEAPQKDAMAARLLAKPELFDALPENFYVAGDHMSPVTQNISEAIANGDVEKLLTRLQNVKKGEFIVGRTLSREETVALLPKAFHQVVEDTFNALLPIYKTMLNR